MQSNYLKTLALALVATFTISLTAFAKTGPEIPAWRTASSNYVKTIQVGPKGFTSVVYTPRTTSNSPVSPTSEKRGPRRLIAIDNGYENVEI